jgi:hypothetical protein
MGAFFESALLFSLAVLIILIGLLIYYFKGRVNDLEQKSMKCLELVGDVYKSHLDLKQHVAIVANARPATVLSAATEQVGGSPRIQVHLEEFSDEEDDSDDSDDDDSDDSDDEDEDFPPQIKMVNVDLSESLEAEEIDIDIDVDMDENNETGETGEIIEITETDPIVVNKIEDEDAEETQTSNETSTVNDRDSYKKMGLPALRGFIISKGYQTDSAKLQKMKKNELIDLIMESQK